MSKFRRNIIISNSEESDIEYVKRQFKLCVALHPASFYGIGEGDRFLLRAEMPGGDWTPTVRAPFLINKNFVRKPSGWWGDPNIYPLRPDMYDYSMIHIPPSINKITINFNKPNYQISCPLCENQFYPILCVSHAWTSNPVVLNISSYKYDLWLAFASRYKNNGTISYTDLTQYKNSFNFNINVE